MILWGIGFGMLCWATGVAMGYAWGLTYGLTKEDE